MFAEDQARIHIDRMLTHAGWRVVTRAEYAPTMSAVAVCEGLLKGNKEADYLLFLEGKAIGVLEAKAERVPLSKRVEQQAEGYTQRVHDWCPAWQRALPFAFISNGRELHFCDLRKPSRQYSALASMHSPRKLAQLAGLGSYYAGLPHLERKHLRNCQFDAITALENSLRTGAQRAQIVLATGAGKTFTACMIAYRLLSYTPARRILFLVDRNNLGRQAEGEFGAFRLTQTGDPFSSIFPVERLQSKSISSGTNLVISTIQRLYSMLTGEDIDERHDDEIDDCLEPASSPIVTTATPLELPSDYFDFIIIDESHRSIYSNWGKVLSYFDTARLIGLTATPVPETLAYFNDNIVYNYSLEQSILDGINVDYRIYRIETRATKEGGAIKPGEQTTEIKRSTGRGSLAAEEEECAYGATELNRSVINPTQIKLVLEQYRDAIYTQLYPEREPDMSSIPKTLIFAQSDFHADQIISIAREVFAGQPPSYIQKITHRSENSNELIRRFRQDRAFRIAVTVNLVATGTDIKPLEVLLFMRDVATESFYTQMKGRGVRTLGDEQLRAVTPNAHSKDHFYIVDAVGVTEREKIIASPSTCRSVPITLKLLLEQITHGYIPDEHLRQLASRLARIDHKSKPRHRQHFQTLAGYSLRELSERFFDALEDGQLPTFHRVEDENSQRKALVAPLAHHPRARAQLLELNQGFLTLLMPGEDELIRVGFSHEEAQSTTQQFEHYVREHRDEIEALRIIYNNTREPITYDMLQQLREQLLHAHAHFHPQQLWNHYAILHPESVTPLRDRSEREALTNLIQLVRYAYQTTPQLRSLGSLAASRFELWCGQAQRPLSPEQKSLMRQVTSYIVGNGSYSCADIAEHDESTLAQMVQSFGSRAQLDELLYSLSGFILAA